MSKLSIKWDRTNSETFAQRTFCEHTVTVLGRPSNVGEYLPRLLLPVSLSHFESLTVQFEDILSSHLTREFIMSEVLSIKSGTLIAADKINGRDAYIMAGERLGST